MRSKAAARRALTDLLDELEEPLSSNAGVRQTVDRLYAIASNLAVSALGEESTETSDEAWALEDVLRTLAAKTKGKKRLLRRLAKCCEALADYAERSHYDVLEFDEINAADELRAELHEGLTFWLQES